MTISTIPLIFFGCSNAEEFSAPDQGLEAPPDIEGRKDARPILPDQSVPPDTGRDGGLDAGLDGRPPADAARDVFVSGDGRFADGGPADGGPADGGPEADGALPPALRADVNIAPSLRLALYSGNFETGEGLLASMRLDPVVSPVVEANIASTDVILRFQAENLYVIDRTGAVIDIYNPDFGLLGQIDAGAWSNPQDIIVPPDGGKAYITRLDAQNDPVNDDDVLIVNPTSGAFLGSIDLTDYTTDDGDRLARAAQMVFLEETGELWVVAQDLSSAFAANTNGKVIVIDTATDTVTRAIPLEGRNPADITYSEMLDKVFVTNTGVYNPDWTIDTSTPYGGVEVINPDTHESEGIFIDDADLGGPVSEIRLASRDRGYVITDFRKIASFNPETGVVISTAVYTSPGFFLPDFTIDAEGRLVIADPSVGLIVEGEEPIAGAFSSLAFLPEE